jgi:hypothetical protein
MLHPDRRQAEREGKRDELKVIASCWFSWCCDCARRAWPVRPNRCPMVMHRIPFD